MREYRVREVGYDDPSDAVRMTTSWGTYAKDEDTISREDVAERFVEERYSDREYYDRKSDIRIGVRPADCKGCGGYGIVDVQPECPYCEGGNAACVTCEGDGLLPVREEPCSRCSELVFVVEVELTPSCSAYVECFDHPLKPRRCYACGERMDNGRDHSMLDRPPAMSSVRPTRYRYACEPTPTNPEVIDHDRNPDGSA